MENLKAAIKYKIMRGVNILGNTSTPDGSFNLKAINADLNFYFQEFYADKIYLTKEGFKTIVYNLKLDQKNKESLFFMDINLTDKEKLMLIERSNGVDFDSEEKNGAIKYPSAEIETLQLFVKKWGEGIIKNYKFQSERF